MTSTTSEISWVNSGWFAHQPTETSWRLLLAIVGVSAIVAVVSYAFTLIALAPSRRAALCILRLAAFLGLFLLLAAPTRIERTLGQPAKTIRPLAVLVDRSDSMTTADNRQHTRLTDALATWNRLEPAALKAFGPAQTFVFAQEVSATAAFADAGQLPGGRTDFFASLQDVLARAPPGGWGGIVTITDGLDTSGVEPIEAQRVTARAAVTAGTPLFFIVGRNRAIEPAFFRLREFKVPARAEPHSVVRLDAIFDSFQSAASTLPVQLNMSGSDQLAGSLRLEAGRHLTTWAAQGNAEAPGTLSFELRVGSERARAEVSIVAPPPNGILFYQGALDWGYRFLTDILQRNEAFTVTPVFDFPFPRRALPPAVLTRLPSPEDLHLFGIIVLTHVLARQIPPAQQAALTRWVSEGGVLLFLVPDDASTVGLAGSELENLLPVVFGSAIPSREPMTNVGEIASARQPGKAVDLIPFAWEKTPRVQEIFATTPEGDLVNQTPRFTTYAHVVRAKPGAEVLARHPNEHGADGRGAILLAVQRYGRGRSVVFTTDALWRWKLSHPSKTRGPELFWGNFFNWLSRDRDPGFYFDHAPVHAPVDQEITLHLVGAGPKPLHLEATLETRRVPLTELPASDASREFRWRPPAAGFWQVEARDDFGTTTRSWISIDPTSSQASELPAAAPHEDLLRSLAAQTSGAVLDDAAPAGWRREPPPIQLLGERHQPLWHRAWIFAALVGIYSLELLLRRKWQLL